MDCRVLLLALLLGACESAPERTGTRPVDSTTAATTAPEIVDAPNTPFDAAEVVFDTTEPPEQIVQIPPRPAPPPRPPIPVPRPTPPPTMTPAPTRSAGRCDVRATESFCFAYTGDEWTPAAARTHCDAAPDAAFASGTCPTEGRIATCTFERESAPGRDIVYTYYAPYDLNLAALACPGTFEPIE